MNTKVKLRSFVVRMPVDLAKEFDLHYYKKKGDQSRIFIEAIKDWMEKHPWGESS